MRQFHYARADESELGPGTFLAGGTTLLDLMKLDVMRPDLILDLHPLRGTHAGIDLGPHGLRLGAMTRMSEAAADARLAENYPVLAQALLLAASPQIRNMATLGGNLLQRTRCAYFRDTRWQACNKRKPGSGCAALEGVTRRHAVLGNSPHCIATYPGDFALALLALDAVLEVQGEGGMRRLPIAELHRLPGDTPHLETNLREGELITAITVPRGGWTKRSLYIKIRDRHSYEFALASAAVAMDLSEQGVSDIRIALGGVATIPWRARAAEGLLRGRPLTEAVVDEATEAAFAGAEVRHDNAYKVKLGQRTLKRALNLAAGIDIT